MADETSGFEGKLVSDEDVHAINKTLDNFVKEYCEKEPFKHYVIGAGISTPRGWGVEVDKGADDWCIMAYLSSPLPEHLKLPLEHNGMRVYTSLK